MSVALTKSPRMCSVFPNWSNEVRAFAMQLHHSHDHHDQHDRMIRHV